MIVAADPILLAHASPIRNGTGLRDVLRSVTHTIGVNARQTMSFMMNAEKIAEVAMSINRNRSGLSINLVSESATLVYSPPMVNCADKTIREYRRRIVGRLIALNASGSL